MVVCISPYLSIFLYPLSILHESPDSKTYIVRDRQTRSNVLNYIVILISAIQKSSGKSIIFILAGYLRRVGQTIFIAIMASVCNSICNFSKEGLHGILPGV